MSERPQTKWKRISLVLLLSALFVLLVVLPLLQFLSGALSTDGMMQTREMLRDEQLQQALLRTLTIAILACGLASIVAIPAAFLAVRMSAPVRILIQVLGFLPLTMPAFLSASLLQNFVAAFALQPLAATMEPLGSYSGEIALILVYALHYLPLILFSLVVGLQGIDRSTVESARNLGAGKLAAGIQVTLPLLTPAYVLGASLVILRVLEDVGTPLILGVEGMLAPQILLSLVGAGLSDPMLNASALVLLLTATIVAALAWSAFSQIPTSLAPNACIRPLRWRSRTAGLLIHLPLLLLFGVLALSPHVWLILVSIGGEWSVEALSGTSTAGDLLQRFANSSRELGATSLFMIASGILTLLLGTALAGLTWRAGPAGKLARSVTTTLIAIPGVILALGFAHAGSLPLVREAAWPDLAWPALVLVVVLKQLPYVERIIASRLRHLHEGARDSAVNLGTRGITLELRINLPMLAGVLLAAFLTGCAAAVVELSSALVLLQEGSVPLAVTLYHSLQGSSDPATASTQALLLVGLVTGLLLLLLWMLRQNWCQSPTSAGGRTAVQRNSP